MVGVATQRHLGVQMGAFEASVGATLGATWTRFLTNSQTTSCRSEMYPDYEWQWHDYCSDSEQSSDTPPPRARVQSGLPVDGERVDAPV